MADEKRLIRHGVVYLPQWSNPCVVDDEGDVQEQEGLVVDILDSAMFNWWEENRRPVHDRRPATPTRLKICKRWCQVWTMMVWVQPRGTGVESWTTLAKGREPGRVWQVWLRG